MATTSQFTIYSSSDVDGPGPIYGSTGSLNKILEYCLISASVSKVAAGWSHPIPNSSSAAGDRVVYAAYTPPSGSQMTLFVNDNAPNGAAGGKEAWMTGWENMTSLCPGVASGSNVGGGTGQFPTPTQLLTTGHTVCRKSSLADNTTQHYWVAFADAYTIYLYIQTGDAAGRYYPFMFGDVFSLKGNSDNYRCLISGRWSENTSGDCSAGDSAMDALAYPYNAGTALLWSCGNTSAAAGGRFMARTAGGGGSSIFITMVADLSVCAFPTPSNNAAYASLAGNIQTPNSPDNSLYLAPLRISEIAIGLIRGRFRGLYQICHPITSFSDGQTFAGGGDYAGKTFMVVKSGPSGGMWAVEISNTVETN